MKSKVCHTCGFEKMLDEFHKKTCIKQDGLSARCKKCSNQFSIEYASTLKGCIQRLCGSAKISVQNKVEFWAR